MPRPKSLDKYPLEFKHLFERASQEPVHIVLESRSQAEALRNDLYTYRSVVYHSEDEGLSIKMQNVRLCVNGATLVAEPIRR